jgi:hypothetical protein
MVKLLTNYLIWHIVYNIFKTFYLNTLMGRVAGRDVQREPSVVKVGDNEVCEHGPGVDCLKVK